MKFLWKFDYTNTILNSNVNPNGELEWRIYVMFDGFKV
jgi:hypothetical protein